MSQVSLARLESRSTAHELSKSADQVTAARVSNLKGLCIVAPFFPVAQFLNVRRYRIDCLTSYPFCKTIAGVYRQLWTCHGTMWLDSAISGGSVCSCHGSGFLCGVRV